MALTVIEHATALGIAAEILFGFAWSLRKANPKRLQRRARAAGNAQIKKAVPRDIVLCEEYRPKTGMTKPDHIKIKKQYLAILLCVENTGL